MCASLELLELQSRAITTPCISAWSIHLVAQWSRGQLAFDSSPALQKQSEKVTRGIAFSMVSVVFPLVGVRFG